MHNKDCQPKLLRPLIIQGSNNDLLNINKYNGSIKEDGDAII